MFHFSVSMKLFQWPAIHFAAFGLMTAGTLVYPTGSVTAAEDRNYGECADELVAAGITADAAAAACALALRPSEVAGCVTGVLAVAAVMPTEALSACSRDRRPDEVTSCVTSIHQELPVGDSLSVLTHCHRSILPERYATCVTGLAAALNYDTPTALARCTAAGYRPENVAPTYIPE